MQKVFAFFSAIFDEWNILNDTIFSILVSCNIYTHIRVHHEKFSIKLLFFFYFVNWKWRDSKFSARYLVFQRILRTMIGSSIKCQFLNFHPIRFWTICKIEVDLKINSEGEKTKFSLMCIKQQMKTNSIWQLIWKVCERACVHMWFNQNAKIHNCRWK